MDIQGQIYIIIWRKKNNNNNNMAKKKTNVYIKEDQNSFIIYLDDTCYVIVEFNFVQWLLWSS